MPKTVVKIYTGKEPDPNRGSLGSFIKDHFNDHEIYDKMQQTAHFVLTTAWTKGAKERGVKVVEDLVNDDGTIEYRHGPYDFNFQA